MRYEESTFAWTDTSTAARPDGLTRIRCETDDRVTTVTLDRPDRLNAIDRTMLDELNAVLRWCDAADEVGVVVLTGAGRAFSAGSEMTEDGFSGAGAPWVAPYQVRKPVLAAIQGAAVGAGLTLAMQCDVRIVAHDAVLALPFVRLGVTAELMGHWNSSGTSAWAARRNCCSPAAASPAPRRPRGGWPPRRCRRRRSSPAPGLSPARSSSTPRRSRSPRPNACSGTRVEADPFEHGRTERLVMEALLEHPDAREGVEAFLQRRRPVWTGRASTDLPPWPTERTHT